MSRPDTNILLSLREPRLTPAQREEQRFLREQRAGILEQQAEARALVQENRKQKQIENANLTAQQNADEIASRLLKENPDVDDTTLYRTLGRYAQPYIDKRRADRVQNLDEKVKKGTLAVQQMDRHAKFLGEFGSLLTGLSQLPAAQRKKANEEAVQGWLQAGLIEEAEAQELLSDDLSDAGLQEAIAANPKALQAQLEAEKLKIQQELDKYKAETDRMRAGKENQPAASIQEYNLAVSQGYKGTFPQWQTEEANRKKVNPPAATVVIQTPQGPMVVDKNTRTATTITDKGSGDTVKGLPTEGERTAKRFHDRMKGAMDDLAKVERDIESLGFLAQGKLEFAPNFAQSETGQKFRQAQRAFTEARLRKDSGAAIPETEFENDRQTYFVQPGDTKGTIQQKARSRQIVLDGLRESAGRAFDSGGKADPLGIR